MQDTHELFLQEAHPEDLNDYYHCFNSSNIVNVVYWWQFLTSVTDVEGDIVECGVGRGRSLITLLSLVRLLEISGKCGYGRKVFALDSFEGFPEPTEFDRSQRNPQKGEWSQSPNNQFEYSEDALQEILRRASLGDISDDKLKVVKGYFNQTSANLDVQNIAILHLDGDLYESVLIPLENLWERVSINGLVVIDDFLADKNVLENEPFPGARLAVETFLKKNDCFEFHVSLRGTPYLIRKK